MKFYVLRAEPKPAPSTRVVIERSWGKVGGDSQSVTTFVDESTAPALLARYELRRIARGYRIVHEQRDGLIARVVRWDAPSSPRVRSASGAPQLGLFVSEEERAAIP